MQTKTLKKRGLLSRAASVVLSLALMVPLFSTTAFAAIPTEKPANNPSVSKKQGDEFIMVFLDSRYGEEVTPVKSGTSPKIYTDDNLYMMMCSGGRVIRNGSGQMSSITPSSGFKIDSATNTVNFAVPGTYTISSVYYDTATSVNYSCTLDITISAGTRPPAVVETTGVTLSPSSTQTLSSVGSTLQFTSNVLPSDATDKGVKYSVKAVDGVTNGTINSNGLFTATKYGASDVYVTTNSGNYTAHTRVYVGGNCTSLTLSKESLELSPGSSESITVTTNPTEVYNPITVNSNNSNITATYDNSTKQVTITALNNANTNNNIGVTGTVTVTCGSISKTISVVAKKPYDPSAVASIEASDIEVIQNQTKKINVTVLPDTASNKNVTYRSDNTSVATVDAAGVVSGVGVGQTTITITSAADTSITKIISVKVLKQPEPAQITLSASDKPTNDTVAITVKSTGDVKYMILPNGNIVDSSDFTYNVQTNGTYSFTVVGITGNRTTKSINIDCIDRTPPTLLVNSSLKSASTVYSVDAIDLKSGVKWVRLPDGKEETSLPASYTQDTEGEVTFVAADNAGNITSKSSTRSVITIQGSNSETFIAYEGIPKEWTNKSATIDVAAYNPTDGVELQIVNPVSRADATGDGTNATTSVVYANATLESNGTINAVVTDGNGNSETVKIEVTKIDKEAPTAKHTVASDGTITIKASDDLSGVKSITTPTGILNTQTRSRAAVSSDEATYSPEYNGTYRFIIEDNAGNLSEHDVQVTGLADPAEPIVPPDSSIQQSDVVIIGTIEPDPESSDAGLIGIVVPTKLDFIIDSSRNFISGKYNFENTGETDLNIKIKEVTPASGTTTNLVATDTFEDWPNITVEQAKTNIGLKLKDVDLSKKDMLLTELTAGTKESIGLTGFYGHKWGNVDDLILRYNMTLEISTTDGTEVIS